MGQPQLRPQQVAINNVQQLCFELERYGQQDLPISDDLIRFEPYWQDIYSLRHYLQQKMVQMNQGEQQQRKNLIAKLHKASVQFAKLDDIYDCIRSDTPSIICNRVKRKEFIDMARQAIHMLTS
jgi:hypothetical protein